MTVKVDKDFVISEISKAYSIDPASTGGLTILCPFHNDRSPSLSISLGEKVPPGIFHCWSCGESGSWNKLASKIGLTTVDGDEFNASKTYLPNLKGKISNSEIIDPDSLILSPLKFNWRGFPKNFLKKFGGQLLWDEKMTDHYVFMPVYYLNNYHGFIRCRIYQDSPGPKYWFNLPQKIFYPNDIYLDLDADTIVLVEGLTDALRLLLYNVPALATLGTQWPLDVGVEYLENLGIKKIIFCYDGDLAGREAVIGNGSKKGYAESLTARGFEVRVMFPPRIDDPYSMPKFYIYGLINLVKKLGGKLINWKEISIGS